MRLALRQILSKNGFDVIGEAADGVLAVDFCRQSRPDLVTMDILMPNMDGLEALRQIKTIDSSIKVIVVSAMGQRKNVMDALSLGAENFIVKPFDEVKITRVLSALEFGAGLKP
ncbi:MAG: response regulator [Candidatus Wallbacteria bacterium]|nr:response regulator [Candidatus Wallbacteria bacterium]MBI4869673.1 response regulator [Candidatus Wallbacteria bacterium]